MHRESPRCGVAQAQPQMRARAYGDGLRYSSSGFAVAWGGCFRSRGRRGRQAAGSLPIGPVWRIPTP
eukprot:4642251-Prymnesium_polylepis.1